MKLVTVKLLHFKDEIQMTQREIKIKNVYLFKSMLYEFVIQMLDGVRKMSCNVSIMPYI